MKTSWNKNPSKPTKMLKYREPLPSEKEASSAQDELNNRRSEALDLMIRAQDNLPPIIWRGGKGPFGI